MNKTAIFAALFGALSGATITNLAAVTSRVSVTSTLDSVRILLENGTYTARVCGSFAVAGSDMGSKCSDVAVDQTVSAKLYGAYNNPDGVRILKNRDGTFNVRACDNKGVCVDEVLNSTDGNTAFNSVKTPFEG